ncbi:hypothetical protein IFM89_006363 [Coptis chinensis]|uniref:Pentatricopeptide repeat-containing protein n=1 Tax=Coptis chinensis TaxID=261450 RepID=A0A835HT63_9MAGN|nr:hypothetical protein IFM89_006363 [Coptis chinensis]
MLKFLLLLVGSFEVLMMKDLIELCKDTGLQSSNATIRNATIKLIGAVHKFIGPTELFGALRGRLYDSNKNLVMATLVVVGGVASAMGPMVEKSSKISFYFWKDSHWKDQLHGLGLKMGCAERLIVQTALIDMYCDYGLSSYGRWVFDKIVDKDVICWNTMIVGYIKCGEMAREWGLALRLYCRMIKVGITPNEFTFAKLMMAYCFLGLKYAKLVHAHVVLWGSDRIENYIPASAIGGRPNVDGQKFKLIDTTWIRRRAVVVSFGSITKALSVNWVLQAIRLADVIDLVIEARLVE